MRLLHATIATLFLCTTAALAIEYLEIESWIWDDGDVEIFLNNTVSGRVIVCAVYDADEKVIDSRTYVTKNMVTKVSLYRLRDRPSLAACAYND